MIILYYISDGIMRINYTVNSGTILNCEFENNKGTGSVIEISDNCDIKPSTSRMIKQTNRTQISIVISYCTFEIEKNSDSSLFYALSKRSIRVNVYGAHIDGNVIVKEMSNLFINSCHFSNDQNSALNSKFLNIDLGNQVLSSKKKKNMKQLSLTIFMELSIVGVTTALLIAFYKRINDNNETSRSNETVEA